MESHPSMLLYQEFLEKYVFEKKGVSIHPSELWYTLLDLFAPKMKYQPDCHLLSEFFVFHYAQ